MEPCFGLTPAAAASRIRAVPRCSPCAPPSWPLQRRLTPLRALRHAALPLHARPPSPRAPPPGSAGRRPDPHATARIRGPPLQPCHRSDLRVPPLRFARRCSGLCTAPAASRTGRREGGREREGKRRWMCDHRWGRGGNGGEVGERKSDKIERVRGQRGRRGSYVVDGAAVRAHKFTAGWNQVITIIYTTICGGNLTRFRNRHRYWTLALYQTGLHAC